VKLAARKAGILDPVKITKAEGIGLLKSDFVDPKNPYMVVKIL
jgi:hypothetical protein